MLALLHPQFKYWGELVRYYTCAIRQRENEEQLRQTTINTATIATNSGLFHSLFFQLSSCMRFSDIDNKAYEPNKMILDKLASEIDRFYEQQKTTNADALWPKPQFVDM